MDYPKKPNIHHMHRGDLSLSVMDWGATMLNLSIRVPSENTQRRLLLGLKTTDEYKDQDLFLNATIGRYANRIKGSSFSLGGHEYFLSSGAEHCLHGGIEGFHLRRFDFIDQTDSSCTLKMVSPDLDQGFPGNFTLIVNFALHPDSTLEIRYYAQCDRECYASITNHAYFNLNGHNSTILNHGLQLDSDAFLELDHASIPTGKIISMENCRAFDFRKMKKIGLDFLNDEQMIPSKGYDHPFLIKGEKDKPFATVLSEDEKVQMQVFTDYPCTQFYSGNYIHATRDILAWDDGKPYANQSAFCLEPGFCPDGPHLKEPKTDPVGPGKPLDKSIAYKFTAR